MELQQDVYKLEIDAEEVKGHKPKVIFVNEENKISRITNYEKYGQLSE